MNGELTYEEAKQLALRRVASLQAEGTPPVEPAIVDTETIETPWGWILYWNTRLYLDTGDLEHAQFGTPPLCVNRGDGSVTPITREARLARQIRRYERKIGARPWWKFW